MDIVNTLLIIVFFIEIVLSIFLFFNRKRNLGVYSFSIASFATSMWVIAMFGFRFIDNNIFLIIPTKILYMAGILISVLFLHFSFNFLNTDENILKKTKIGWAIVVILTITTLLLISLSDLVIKDVEWVLFKKTVFFGDFYIPYSFLMFFCFLWAYKNFTVRFFEKEKHSVERRQLIYIILGTGVSVIFGLIYDIILPYIGNFDLYWLGPVMTLVFVLFTTYSIFKHQLFNVRVIIVELLTFVLWIFLFIRTIVSNSYQDQLINGGLLVIVIILGIFLIRSVLKEVETREHIEILNIKLKELDRQKSEFLSIASHQFRSPLSAIKGYTSLIMEGSYGQIDEKIKQPVKNVFDSTNNLAMIVEDFLNVSRIEQGRMEYKFENLKVNEIIEKVIEEMKPSITDSGLEFSFNYDKSADYTASIDISKFRQVITNLIDNALKYTKYGWIRTELNKTKDEKILFKLSDSGVGIPEKELPNLFTLFKRADNANKVNVKGTGLGLYIVKKIMEAHGGRVWAESDGEGKGAEFYVELNSKPLNEVLNP